jgi:iron(III) transport system ATP-binding protein
MTSVTAAGLVKRFGPNVAVNGISFEVSAGQFATLLGPSGCGKTTTLRMIAGLERPDAGEIRIGPRVLNSADVFVQPEKREIGMVFQSYAIWPHLSVFENVAFPLRERRVPRSEIAERVMATLDLVGLAPFAQRPAPLLSGGQQQRVALARALVSGPQILLLDEPLSNLDAKLREQMRYEIRNMQVRLGITTILVTHDQVEAMTLSDHLIVMNVGSIEQAGSPREVYEHPANAHVMDFVGKVNHLRVRIRESASGQRAVIGESELPLAESSRFADGDEAVLAFRSEAVRIAPETGDIRGVVATSTYLGSEVQYTIQVGESVVRVATSPSIWLAPGEPVRLELDLARARLWRPSDTAAPA